MSSISSLSEELSTLERRWERLTTVPEAPRSLLRILNYSLSSQGQGEVFMTRVLRHLLDPTEPHGMEDEFVRGFLEGLRSHQQTGSPAVGARTFDEDTYDLDGVDVDRQVRLGSVGESEAGTIERTGPVDLVVESPGEWYLVIELKFGATENNLHGDGPSQTEAYASATHIEDRPKSAYESGGYYLYLHTSGSKQADDDRFTNWTWEELAEDFLMEFISSNTARYPNRTGVQLRELHDDIRELTGMTEDDQNAYAKTELYLEHYDAISDVTEAFDEQWGQFSEEWADRLAGVLSAEGYGDVLELDDQLAGIELDRNGGTERWVCRARDTDWAILFMDGWWRRTDDLTVVHDRPADLNDARIGFYHRLQANRDIAVGEGTLELTFRNMGANDDAFIAAFNRQLRASEADIRRMLPSSAELASITDTRRDLFTSTYDIRPEVHDTFFEAYVTALQTAFEDLVVDNGELIRLIDETYDESIEMYR